MLKEIGVEYVKVPHNTISARHLFVIKVKNRDRIIEKLQNLGIGAAVNYRSIHILKYYKSKYNYKKSDFPISYEFGQSVLSLPLYPKLRKEEYKHIIKQLKTII